MDEGEAETTDGVRQIDLVGCAQIVEAEDFFYDVGLSFKDMTAMDAGEQAAGNGRRVEDAVLLDEDVVDCAFRDFIALIQEDHVIVSGLRCGLQRFSVEGAMRGFVKVHGIGRVGALTGNADLGGG